MGEGPSMIAEPTDLESAIACLGLAEDITVCLALSPAPPTTIGDLLILAREDRLGAIRGIGPARKRAIEQSLRFAGCQLGERPGRQFFLRGRSR
jgi:hypothetical protein